jgi:hypothetical protein
MAVQPAQGVVADRAQRDDLFSRFQRQRIVYFNGRHFRIARQIAGSPVMHLCRIVRLVASCPCHV